MAKNDPELRVHKDWLGLLQPVGLVVSPPALIKAQAVPSQNVAELQQKLLFVVENPPESALGTDDEPAIGDLLAFFRTVLDWSLDDIADAPGGPSIPDGLELILPDYHETLRPTYAVLDSMGDGECLMLVQVLSRGTALDEACDEEGRTGWSASPQAKLERLMREVKVPAGLLCNGDAVRLIYAPSGESSGYLTFPVAAMCEVSGRPILAALHMLLSEHRVFSAPDGRRLRDVLSESRKYQAEVSNALSDQVLGALWELLRGFQASDPDDGIRIFDQTAQEDPQHVYGGLLTLLMRLIFVLYAEDEGLMPEGEVYANNYSVSGLYDRLRTDGGRYPDTMDQRYGAYAWLLSLFRLIFDGGGHGGLRLPTRHGQLFNPDEFAFLEGRPRDADRVKNEKFEAPRVSDGCIHRVLDALLVLDGERLSYRALDVEQVGSVYEAMMGYEVERAFGRSIAVKPKHIVVSVDELLEVDGVKREKWLKDHGDSELADASAAALKDATTAEDVVAALGRRVSPRSLDAAGTPRLLPPGTLYLQPGEERRRTGSHYTPRELTQPIVRTTLRPILKALGEMPTPEQILALKVCDPAMGSGAFLVETCRQLAERLVGAWETHDAMPKIPADEEPILHARRLVAQRCLYGVDKNPFAVNLAKLSIWLVTLARDHAFTFIDHSLKHGDSLVGLTKRQIASFHWKTDKGPAMDLFEEKLKQDIEEALGWRIALQGLDEGDYNQKREAWCEAESVLADARLIGDLAVAAFMGADKGKARGELRNHYRCQVEAWRENEANRLSLKGIVEELTSGENSLTPLHWEIEFPEVFGRENPGFDAMVGNPPYLGGRKLSTVFGVRYPSLIRTLVLHEKGSVNLVGYFVRSCAEKTRLGGQFAIVATSSLLEGETRACVLQSLVREGNPVTWAKTKAPWPGAAGVHVVQFSMRKGLANLTCELDGRCVPVINSRFEARDEPADPLALTSNKVLHSDGVKVQGIGFVLSQAEAEALMRHDERNYQVVWRYVTGEDLNSLPHSNGSRWVINFGDRNEKEAMTFPEPFGIVEERVKPYRDGLTKQVHEACFWKFWDRREKFFARCSKLNRIIVMSKLSKYRAPTFGSTKNIYSEKVKVFASDDAAMFAVLQSQAHDAWSLREGSSTGVTPAYSGTKCFDTFALPPGSRLYLVRAVATDCYEMRRGICKKHGIGLTEFYNRFHDPNNHEPQIVKLRELHTAMDRAVLDAYGWTDISTDCEFLLDYEIDEETWGTKKKPYRYRWPEAVHDEVLSRLLDLNQKRYQEEVAAGLHDKKGKKRSAPKKAKPKAAPAPNATRSLFDTMDRPEDA